MAVFGRCRPRLGRSGRVEDDVECLMTVFICLSYLSTPISRAGGGIGHLGRSAGGFGWDASRSRSSSGRSRSMRSRGDVARWLGTTEGTVRNFLKDVEAAEVRNRYAPDTVDGRAGLTPW